MITDAQKQLISAYYDNALNFEEKVQAENLLAQNPEAKAYLKDLQRLSSVLPSLKEQSLSPDAEIKMRHFIKKENSMRINQLKKPALILATLIICTLVITNVYVKRGIQGKLKSSTDDIGDQYSPQATRIITTSSTQEKEKTSFDQLANVRKNLGERHEGMIAQYEPYYQRTQYEVDKNVVQKKILDEGFVAGDGYSRAAVVKGDAEFHSNMYYPNVPYPLSSSSEEYKIINDNGFKSTSLDPLSTLSIDVDTASYSNVRRYLNNNQMPPVDAVRIEEMINYFDYQYPEPKWNQPFSVTMEQSNCPWNARHHLVLVGLQGKRLAENQIPESNLVFLIDVSGSMNSADKLPLLKNSLKMMVSKLRPQERISMVVYAGSAGLVLDSTPGHDKQTIMAAIDRLQAGGSTAGGQGIALAYNIARKNFIRNGNNRVILATDGDFNVGVSSDNELIRMIEQERKSGIFLTVLGLGTGNLKDGKMEQLANKGNGNYFYIDNLNEGKKVLVDELGSTIFTIAKDVKIQIEFNPAFVKEYRLIGYENRTLAKEDFNDDTKDAGELGAGHTVTALYEIVPAGSWESQSNVDALKYQKTMPKKSFFTDKNEIMTVKLRYKEPNVNTSKLIQQTLKQTNNGFGSVWQQQQNDNLIFASAVAEFGMLLRASAHKGQASYQNVMQRIQASAYVDLWGYKNELLSLVQKAAMLDQRSNHVERLPDTVTYYPTQMDYGVDQHQGYGQK
jgi:Ca-activated chloride channel family protein